MPWRFRNVFSLDPLKINVNFHQSWNEKFHLRVVEEKFLRRPIESWLKVHLNFITFKWDIKSSSSLWHWNLIKSIKVSSSFHLLMISFISSTVLIDAKTRTITDLLCHKSLRAKTRNNNKICQSIYKNLFSFCTFDEIKRNLFLEVRSVNSWTGKWMTLSWYLNVHMLKHLKIFICKVMRIY